MPFYWTALKVDRTETANALKSLKNLPKQSPNPGIKVYYIGNVFGEWDNCVWFEAENSEHAIEYVQNTLAKIPGIAHTYTWSTSPIQNYHKYWK